ncbi:MAG: hypothetical protein K5931_09230 [Lachnospiraceae bacterium]|nr:hypothetical protein [Lachnospiraceae bacterium]
MKKIYMKTLTISGLFVIMAGLILGCGKKENVNGMTDEEIARDERLAAEYAAGLILKYDKGNYNKLTYKPYVPLPTIPPKGENPPEGMEEGGNGKDMQVSSDKGDIPERGDMPEEGMPPMEDGGGQEVPPEEELVAQGSISEALGVPDFNISYKNYELCQQYPEEQNDSLFFSMKADEGEKLLILHFDLNNPTGGPLECRVIDSNARIRLLINDTERINQQMTILLNDLKSYEGTVQPGESIDTILVFDVTDEIAQNIQSMQLIIVTESGDQGFPL